MNEPMLCEHLWEIDNDDHIHEDNDINNHDTKYDGTII